MIRLSTMEETGSHIKQVHVIWPFFRTHLVVTASAHNQPSPLPTTLYQN